MSWPLAESFRKLSFSAARWSGHFSVRDLKPFLANIKTAVFEQFRAYFCSIHKNFWRSLRPWKIKRIPSYYFCTPNGFFSEAKIDFVRYPLISMGGFRRNVPQLKYIFCESFHNSTKQSSIHKDEWFYLSRQHLKLNPLSSLRKVFRKWWYFFLAARWRPRRLVFYFKIVYIKTSRALVTQATLHECPLTHCTYSI